MLQYLVVLGKEIKSLESQGKFQGLSGLQEKISNRFLVAHAQNDGSICGVGDDVHHCFARRHHGEDA
jgi:hypothetical protein